LRVLRPFQDEKIKHGDPGEGEGIEEVGDLGG